MEDGQSTEVVDRHEREDLEKLIEETELPIERAVPLLCRKKGSFTYEKKQRKYCTRDYECIYKGDTNRCMNREYGGC